MNEREKTRGGKHWDPRGASRPPPGRAAGALEGGRPRGAGRPGLPASSAPPAARLPGASFAGNFPRRISARPVYCPVRLGAGVSSRVPTLPKPTGAEGWAERGFSAHFYWVAAEGGSLPRLPPRPAAGGRRATGPGQPSPVPGAGGGVSAWGARRLWAPQAARILCARRLRRAGRESGSSGDPG